MTEELEQAREKRKQEMMQRIQQQQLEEESQQTQKHQQEAMKNQVVKRITTKKARERIGRIRAADPQKAEKLESMIIQLYQAGRIQGKVNDETLRKILKQIKSQKRETKITRR